jgi:hypothetical protein
MHAFDFPPLCPTRDDKADQRRVTQDQAPFSALPISDFGL